MNFVYSVLFFIVAIGVLVTVHEFGHFWVARRLGVKVLRFSVGFGRPLWSRRLGRDRTEYCVATIPLGGYVKMLDEREGEVPEGDLDRAFNRQSVWVRFAVVFAGPFFNFLFAAVAYWLMFVVGVSGLRPLVAEVTPGSPAAAAGIEARDEIVAVDGRDTPTWEAVVQTVLGKVLEEERLTIDVVGVNGVRERLTTELDGIVLDDLTRGRFFETFGMQPLRPTIPPVIGGVETGSPAEAAGLRAGDRVVAIDGSPVDSWGALVEAVRAHPGEPLEAEVVRGDARRTLVLTPKAETAEDGSRIGRIGARAEPPEGLLDQYYITQRQGPLSAVTSAVVETGRMTVLTLHMLWKMVTQEVSVENLSGPISIAQYAGYTAQVGFSEFVKFLGIVSISLGILNLLPIPVLDGGHLLYYVIELFTGRPVSEEVQAAGQRLGIVMLVGLMGLAFYNDIARLFS
ncbi:MAG: RIP metalloprotease RseP [Gammaproteobacteria bacterium]|nr:RIP metalloprotease RseP [Gammaproteobacteria bacterium]NIR84159.1 RIP metalloprotease RseP [Gammaproteobacteria bacterium]NIR89471.1 RIP metalloprotease RseP [Gammaproteobacteria bacterium]NIU05314.1 RIP metalloprotease RseP [Gammaproteobacteria bacterium]NIV52254.1 RIP metalloprotease RseP [Gammaproteobacteria bacterium]